MSRTSCSRMAMATTSATRLEIAKQNGATVTTNYDLCMWLATKGVEKFNPMNTGGTIDLGGFSVTMVRADHSSGDERGRCVDLSRQPVWRDRRGHGRADGMASRRHRHFLDMALIAEIHQPKVAIVPIGDRFTMGAKTAAKAVKRFIKAETVIPCHFGTFPIIEPNADKFLAEMKGDKAKVVVPEKGKPFTV